MIHAAIDASRLLKMSYTSLLACVTVAVIFSAAVLGVIRAAELRRAHRNTAAALYGTLASVGVIALAAIIVYGLTLVADKG
jgi:hypothetical protein